MQGPGKYDDICTHVREEAQAEAVIVIVINGNKGSGFSVQGPVSVLLNLADTLTNIASEMRNDATSMLISEMAHDERPN